MLTGVQSPERGTVSTPRSLELSPRVRATPIRTARGSFATLRVDPAGGIGERQPALLVPGYTGSKEDFLAVLEPLAAAGRAVTAMDLRGQYESGPAPGRAGYAFDQLAADVVAVAAMLADDTGRVHVVGHSFGGLVARQAALAKPAALASLTLLCSGPAAIGGPRAQALRDLLDYLRPADDDVAELGSRIAQLWQSQLRPQAQADGTPTHIIDFLERRTLRTCPLGLAVMAEHLLGCPDRTAELADAATSFPILVSYGENDDAWPPDAQDLMAKRLGAERICIPQAAHSPAVEAPETTAAMLTRFWNKAESTR
jgi:pimeloyl-ACP methyl ester carboxylesterase